ncbi:MAG: DUF2993 domain-containing protein [Actinomycetota bacterium]|nr:DUF2993 domain-containing protein [Actinomycetota bacterium]
MGPLEALRRRRLTALLAAVALVLVVLAVAQVVLPGIAAQQLRDRLARSGQVLSVSVDAFPAVELLWHHADRVTVRLGRFRSSPGGLARLLDESSSVGVLSASVAQLDTGLLSLRNAALSKSGSTLSGAALITQSDLRTALPVLDSVTPVASAQGTLTLRGTATLFGLTASVDATLREQDGGIVVTPQVPFGGLAAIRVFSDPRLAVTAISAAPAASGFTVRATGVLH